MRLIKFQPSLCSLLTLGGGNQGPVDQMVDSTIHWTSQYLQWISVHKTNCGIRWIALSALIYHNQLLPPVFIYFFC